VYIIFPDECFEYLKQGGFFQFWCVESNYQSILAYGWMGVCQSKE